MGWGERKSFLTSLGPEVWLFVGIIAPDAKTKGLDTPVLPVEITYNA